MKKAESKFATIALTISLLTDSVGVRVLSELREDVFGKYPLINNSGLLAEGLRTAAGTLISQPAISAWFSRAYSAGLVNRRRIGKEVYYSLNVENFLLIQEEMANLEKTLTRLRNESTKA
jgi:DNA-binding transcriptional ArsR family regulator